MNLYKISQCVNEGYNTYDCAIVCAKDEDFARKIHPNELKPDHIGYNWYDPKYQYYPSSSWVDKLEDVSVQLIGIADSSIEENLVICASFNAR